MSTFRKLQEFYYTQNPENYLELVDSTLSLSNKKVKGDILMKTENRYSFSCAQREMLPLTTREKRKT